MHVCRTPTLYHLRPDTASETRAALFHNGQSDTLLDRSGHTISELTGSNQALVAGGANSAGSVLDSISTLSSSSASISTDKLDYMPGETATISGRGFQPGEIVRLKIHEDPHTPQKEALTLPPMLTATSPETIWSGLRSRHEVHRQRKRPDFGLDRAHVVYRREQRCPRRASWAPVNTVTTFSTLYRKTTGGTVQHVRITLPVGYTNISVAAMAFSSGTWSRRS